MSTRTAPRRRPAAALVASLVALLLLVGAVVAVRELAVSQGWTGGEAWVPAALQSLDGLRADTTVLTVGILLGVVGLLLVLAGLRPASRTHQRADVEGHDVWVSTSAVAAVARDAADRAPGVGSAETRATRRRVDVVVRPAGAGEESASSLAAEVSRQVTERLSGLDSRTVRVRVRETSA